jgi:hypothetical protein
MTLGALLSMLAAWRTRQSTMGELPPLVHACEIT